MVVSGEDSLYLRAELQDKHDLFDSRWLWCKDSIRRISSSHYLWFSNNLMKSELSIVTHQPLDNLAPIPFPSGPLLNRVTQCHDLGGEQSRLYVKNGECLEKGSPGKTTIKWYTIDMLEQKKISWHINNLMGKNCLSI